MRSLLTLLLLGLAASSGVAADTITADQYRTLLEVIRPTSDEDRWATIPWRINLWEARKEAAKEGKPILLWEMDGHPLGCT
jgi:hypothetical protein